MNRKLAWWAAAIAASVCVVVAVWSVPYLPTHDGPEHVLLGHLENRLRADPNASVSAFLEPTSQFANRGFSHLFIPLERSLGWLNALRLTLSIIALIVSWSTVALASALAGERRWMSLCGFVLAFPWAFYMGFWSFVLGSALGMALAALAIWRPARTAIADVLFGVGVLVIAHVHIFTAVLGGAFLVAVRMSQKSRVAPKAGLVPFLLRASVPGWIALAAALYVNDVASGFASNLPTTVWRWEEPGSFFAQLPALTAPGPAWRSCPALALVLCGAFLAAIRLGRKVGSLTGRVVGGCGLAAMLFALLAPLEMPGWELFGPRFLHLGGALLLATLVTESPLRDEEAARVKTAVTGIAGLAGLTAIIGSFSLHKSLASTCNTLLAAVQAAPNADGPLLPMVIDPWCGVEADPARSPVPHLKPLQHAAALLAVGAEGHVPFMFIGVPAIHPFIAKEHGQVLPLPEGNRRQLTRDARADPEVRRMAVGYFGVLGVTYRGLMLIGAEKSDTEILTSMGYALELDHGAISISRFEGCSVHIAMPPGLTGTLHATWGAWPVTTPMGRTSSTDGGLSLAPAPCGEVWIAAAYQPDPGKPPVPLHCGKPHPAGVSIARVSEGAKITCSSSPPPR